MKSSALREKIRMTNDRLVELNNCKQIYPIIDYKYEQKLMING